jgi:hypothetical protein
MGTNLHKEGEEMNIQFWAGDKRLDEWMHVADLFGKYKMLVSTLEPLDYQAIDVGLERRAEQMAAMLLTLRKQTVVAAFYVENLPEFCWRDRSIWEISDGHKSGMLTEILRAYGWAHVPLPHKIGSPEFDAARSEATALLASAPKAQVIA